MEKLVPYHIWQVCDEELDGQGDESEVERRQREEEGVYSPPLLYYVYLEEEKRMLMRKKRKQPKPLSRE